MIESARVLVPYQDCLAYGKGRIFETEGKNVLITGDNGTGKSSLLFSLAFSYARSAEFGKKRKFPDKGPYVQQPFPAYVNRSLTQERKPRKRRTEKELLEWLLPETQTDSRVLRDYELVQVLRNIDLFPGSYSCSKEDLLREVRRTRRQEYSSEHTHLDAIVEEYVDFVPTLADHLGQPVEKVYGVLRKLERGTAFREDFPFARFFFMELQGDLSGSLVALYHEPGGQGVELRSVRAPDIVLPQWKEGSEKVLDDGSWRRWARSTGQRCQAMLERIFEAKPAHVLLDEPMEGLDEGKQDALERRLQDDTGTQYFVITHDRLLKKNLRQNSRWVEWTLPGR